MYEMLDKRLELLETEKEGSAKVTEHKLEWLSTKMECYLVWMELNILMFKIRS